MNRLGTPESRVKGDKARVFTDIRRKLDKMERDEWRAWYKECLETLPKDEAIWEWITRERKFADKFKGGVYKKTQPKKGRKPHWRNQWPYTRHTEL